MMKLSPGQQQELEEAYRMPVEITDANEDCDDSEMDSFQDEARHSRRSSAVDLDRGETKAVRILRVVVLLVLVAAALAMSCAVYFYMKWNEVDALMADFQDTSQRLVDGFHANTVLRLQSMDAYATSLTTSVQDDPSQTWPFVTFTNFEARTTAVRATCQSDYIGVYPYVNAANRKAWENYTMQPDNLQWLNESIAYQQAFYHQFGRTVGNRAPNPHRYLEEEEPLTDDDQAPEINATFDGPYGMSPVLYTYGEDYLFVVDQTLDHYYPMWQVSPYRGEGTIIDINYNNNDPNAPPSFSGAAEVCRTTKTAVFAGMWNVDEDGYVLEDDDYDFRTHPAATLYYPIFDTAIGDDKVVVAVIDLDVEFGPLFSSVLPENSNHMVAVVESTCDQIHSYRVKGAVVEYLGPEDYHDANFDDMVLQTLLTDFESTITTDYNGAPLNTEFCPWVLSVYATQNMKDAHISYQPIGFMMAVLGIFLFTCLTFVVYDRFVEKRQSKVKAAAVNSDEIVSSLFPKAFKDQLYHSNKTQQEASESNKEVADHPSDAFRSSEVSKFLAQDDSNHNEMQRSNRISSSPPMAELYPNCSVFFADIAGFTQWSSTRTPTEVFTLLETLYGEFDKIAHRHSVFKIETIGDCYVAVTGLPKAQPKHALTMVRFARDCLVKMNKLTQMLIEVLGEDTANLAMRVGINSGPVTAGILRGEKARFQLFGDTVNTAARMESNGKKDCIHVSQSTADELTASGKGQWIHKRDELVAAKGKGMMQTYWVRPTSAAMSVASSAFTTSTLLSDDTDHQRRDHDDDDRGLQRAIASLKSIRDLRASATSITGNRASSLTNTTGVADILQQASSGGKQTSIGWVEAEVDV